MSQVTEDTRARVARELIVASPPGQFNNVVSDIRTLVGDDDLLTTQAADGFRTFNTDQLLTVDVPGSARKLLISTFNQVEDNVYYDPSSSQLVVLDHIKQALVEVRPASGSESSAAAEPFRAAVDSHLAGYIREAYPEGHYNVFAPQDNELVVCIAAQKLKLESFWAGRWRSVWRISLDGSSAKLSGSVKTTVHYFENGNVQLQTNFPASLTVSYSDEASLGQAVATSIKNAEQHYHRALEDTYGSLSETFKVLRRALPLTRQLINWASVGTYRLGAELTGKR